MKVFFAGSFNPFTVGHASIVERALRMFDEIIIGIGINVNKEGAAEAAEERCDAIRRLYAGVPRVSVTAYSSLTAIAAAEAGCSALLRGIRSVSDFESERQMADVNMRINGMETIIMFSLPEYGCISSSLVRELQAFGYSTSGFVAGRQNTAEGK